MHSVENDGALCASWLKDNPKRAWHARGFSDYRSPVGMANENCRSFLRCKNSLGNCYVVLQRYCRILDDAHVVAVSLQDLVDALPASAIHKATVDENNVLHGSIPPSFNDAV